MIEIPFHSPVPYLFVPFCSYGHCHEFGMTIRVNKRAETYLGSEDVPLTRSLQFGKTSLGPGASGWGWISSGTRISGSRTACPSGLSQSGWPPPPGLSRWGSPGESGYLQYNRMKQRPPQSSNPKELIKYASHSTAQRKTRKSHAKKTQTCTLTQTVAYSRFPKIGPVLSPSPIHWVQDLFFPLHYTADSNNQLIMKLWLFESAV